MGARLRWASANHVHDARKNRVGADLFRPHDEARRFR